ncbi:MAG: CDP-diacylglycerol--glycerol-3-phosphate 3-phosphatidyltransferase [Bifidobacteriaceae bacterium]|jgi:CDP-diacylglycerol--glycerol-3-phosphate 3-phosphatidyltransferase|nr:CDP-diacylglycerol--glycerol-3-phosphate 3-phosphatidyltransferase [Bifidobacteriaceae bacterium]
MAENTKSNLNLPNVLTVIRIILVPLYLFFLLTPHDSPNFYTYRFVAFAVFTVAMLTDKLDGDIARKRQIITNFGKLMDPIADKLLLGSAFIAFSYLGEIPVVATAIILFREVFITLYRFLVIKRKKQVIPASIWGKVKTVTQSITLGAYSLPYIFLPQPIHIALFCLLIVAVVITVASGAEIVLGARRRSE